MSKKEMEFSFPSVSLIVPVYNEEKIILEKIQNLEEVDYPIDRIEIIFVDGHSTDKTAGIIMDQIKNAQKPIRLVSQQKRDGYTSAVVEGILSSKGEIIVVTDAASYYCPDAIQCLVRHFVDPKIGAVTGKEIVLGGSKEVGPQLEKSYRFFYDFVRVAETEMDSTPDSKGEVLAVRKEICINLLQTLGLSPNASFDSCVPYQAKLMGYRTIYDENSKYSEHAPASSSDRFLQQARRATVLIGALFLFKNMLFNKKFGKFGLLILPVHFILDCILPIIFILGIISLVVSTFLNPIGVLLLWIIAAIFTVASMKTRLFLFAFVQSQFALVVALFRLARRKESLFINTIPSTRSLVSKQN